VLRHTFTYFDLLPTTELEYLKKKILTMILNHHTNSSLCILMRIWWILFVNKVNCTPVKRLTKLYFGSYIFGGFLRFQSYLDATHFHRKISTVQLLLMLKCQLCLLVCQSEVFERLKSVGILLTTQLYLQTIKMNKLRRFFNLALARFQQFVLFSKFVSVDE